jgi:hypothetical protein
MPIHLILNLSISLHFSLLHLLRLLVMSKMYLIKGVRVTLIKNALSNLSAYFMSLFPLPVSVANCLEKLQHNFLWGGMGEEFKFRLVSLIKVCTMISKEGLGVCNLFVFNWVLMGSCGVTFMRERPYGGWL